MDESQPICKLYPDHEPVPTPVPEEQVPAKQAEEEQVQSDDDSGTLSKMSSPTTNLVVHVNSENVTRLNHGMPFGYLK
jgi:hypothetical protein